MKTKRFLVPIKCFHCVKCRRLVGLKFFGRTIWHQAKIKKTKILEATKTKAHTRYVCAHCCHRH